MAEADPSQTTVTSDGQVALPKAIRDQHRWDAGTKLSIEMVDGGVMLRREPLFPRTTVDQVFGILKYDGPPKSLEEMDQAITDEVRERHARGRY